MLQKTNTFNLNLNLMQCTLQKFSKNWEDGAWSQIWKPEFDPLSTYGREKKFSWGVLWSTHVFHGMCVHMPPHTCIQDTKIIKFGKQFYNCKNETCLRKQTRFTWFKHRATYTYVKQNTPLIHTTFMCLCICWKGKRFNLQKNKYMLHRRISMNRQKEKKKTI